MQSKLFICSFITILNTRIINVVHRMNCTEDGFIESCRQWKCSESEWKPEGKDELSPVLLLNGHSAESYWLATEPNDLVRTLLEAGHETWLLQPRLHPLNPSNDFTIEDIGRFDIPAGKKQKVIDF